MTKKNTAGLREVGNTWSVEKNTRDALKVIPPWNTLRLWNGGKGEWQNVIPTSPSRTP